MDQLAEHLDELGDAIDSDQVAEILRLLAMGKTATFIIDIHDLKADGV